MNEPDEVADMTIENGCTCETPDAAILCGFCSEMLYAAQWEARCLDAITMLHTEVGELQQEAVSKGQLEEEVESAVDDRFESRFDDCFERAVDNGDAMSERGTQELIDESFREYKHDHEDAISEGITEALQDYLDEDDTHSEIEREVGKLRYEINGELAEHDAKFAAMPTTFWERLRWLFTGEARRSVILSAAK